MPRIARGLADGLIYHVINRGNGRQEVFHKSEDYRAFVNLIGEAKEKHPLKLCAYCLMPTSTCSCLPTKGRSKQMDAMVHDQPCPSLPPALPYQRSFWQGRYKCFIVQEDTHLLTVVRYIEGNPVKAQLTFSAGEWNWSSHREQLNGAKLLDELPITLPEHWTQNVDMPITDNELEKMQRSINRQTPFGGVPWQQRVCAELGLESPLSR